MLSELTKVFRRALGGHRNRFARPSAKNPRKYPLSQNLIRCNAPAEVVEYRGKTKRREYYGYPPEDSALPFAHAMPARGRTIKAPATVAGSWTAESTLGRRKRVVPLEGVPAMKTPLLLSAAAAKISRLRMAGLSIPIVAILMLGAGSSWLRADKLTVTLGAGGLVTIVDPAKPNTPDVIWDTTTNTKGGTTTDTGGYDQMNDPGGAVGNNMIVRVDGQTWAFNLVAFGNFWSDQELSILSFTDAQGTMAEFEDSFCSSAGGADNMVLLDGGPDSFQISGLLLYDGIPSSYFSQANFDSAAAIAAGTLYSNVVAGSGPFTVNSSDANEYLVPTNPTTYDLMEVTGEQVLPGGGLGTPETFYLGNYQTPEPGTLTLLGGGLLALAGVVRPKLRRG
jgi:hypothetical protein